MPHHSSLRRNTVEYIKSELDELEREEFFRLKRSQDKKKKDIAEKAAEKAAMLAAEQAKERKEAKGPSTMGTEADPDLMF